MRRQMVIWFALLFGACFALRAKASVVFQDDLDGIGTPGADIVGTVPDVGGSTWVAGGQDPGGQILFAPGGGVQDIGPNSRSSNTWASSSLLVPFGFSTLSTGEVIHLRVTMANISSTPSTNPLESSRIDLATDTSGHITLGELSQPEDTVHDWNANSYVGNPISSHISTKQSGLFVLDLYLDPSDAFGDGPTLNAILIVNGSYPFCGTIVGLSPSTIISEVHLVRNIDDEVFFRNLTLEAIPAPGLTSESCLGCDTEAPIIACPADIAAFVVPKSSEGDPHRRFVPQGSGSGAVGAVVTYTAPVGMDNCPGATTMQTAGLPSGDTFPLGPTVNTFKVTDAAGNADSCSFTVTVSETVRRWNQNALIALHARTTVLSKGQTVCTAAPTIPCTDYRVTWPPLTPAYVYLIAARGDPDWGLLGLSCGIQYDDTPGTGTKVVSWTECSGNLGGSWKSDTWPASGSGIRLLWGFAGDSGCQRTIRGTDGVHALAGAFYVYSYGNPREFKVTYNTTVMIPELRVVDCRGVESLDFPLTQAARVMFTNAPATFPGYNPCGGSVVGVPEEKVVVTSMRLHAAPNPFRGLTMFELTLAEPENVEAEVCDITGRHVKLLHSGPLVAGVHPLAWNGLDETGHRCQSGVYFIRVDRGGWRMATKVMLLR